MNKSATRKKWGERGQRGRSGTKLELFSPPRGLPVPLKCNRLNPCCYCGFSSIHQTVPNWYHQDQTETKINAYTLTLMRFPSLNWTCGCVRACVCVSIMYTLVLCVNLSEHAYLAGGKTPDISSQLGASWACSGVENVFVLSGEDGKEGATKRGMSGSKLRKTQRQKTPQASNSGGSPGRWTWRGWSSPVCLFVGFACSLERVRMNY